MTSRVYGRFAKYYDIIYHDLVDYEGDCDYLEALFRKFARAPPASILDLGCGSGNHALLLGERGYHVTGIDLSRALLREGRTKLRDLRVPVKLLYGDMERFDLDAMFDVAICMFGAFGYLLTNRSVLSHFACVRRHMDPHGLYAFEFWQESGVRPGHRSWVHREKPFRLIRLDETDHDPKRHRITIDFRFFAFEGARLKERFTESHIIRVYDVRDIRRLLAGSGLRLLAAYRVRDGERGFAPVRKDSFRVMAVATPAG